MSSNFFSPNMTCVSVEDRMEFNRRREIIVRPRSVGLWRSFLERYRLTSQSIVYIHATWRHSRAHSTRCPAAFFSNGIFLYHIGDAEHNSSSKEAVCRAVREVCLALKAVLELSLSGERGFFWCLLLISSIGAHPLRRAVEQHVRCHADAAARPPARARTRSHTSKQKRTRSELQFNL